MSPREDDAPAPLVANAATRSCDVSVIIVTFNCLAYVRRCLASISSHSGDRSPEIVVFDNASSDHTIEHLRSEFPGVTVLRSEQNLGYGAAVNLAVPHTSGRNLVLLNPDTELTPGTLEPLLALAGQACVGVVGPRLVLSGGVPQSSARRFPSPWRLWLEVLRLHLLLSPRRRALLLMGTYYDQDETRPVDWVSGACHVMSRATWDRVGELTERTFCGFDDLDYCMRADALGLQTWFCAESLVMHHCGVAVSERWTSPEIDSLGINNAFVILEEHWPAWRVKVYAAAELFGALSEIPLARRHCGNGGDKHASRAASSRRAVLVAKLLLGIQRPQQRCEPGG